MNLRLKHPWMLLAGALLIASPSFAPAAVRMLRDAPWLQATARANVRAVFFSRDGVAATYVIDYGQPQWQAEYDQQLDEMTIDKRMRLGKDAWTSLDTQCPLRIAGKEIKAGYYYLALERSKKGWFLVVLDAASIRKRRTDAVETKQTSGGTMIPLEYDEAPEAAGFLSISLEAHPENEFNQTLRIVFGKHRLSATIDAKA